MDSNGGTDAGRLQRALETERMLGGRVLLEIVFAGGGEYKRATGGPPCCGHVLSTFSEWKMNANGGADPGRMPRVLEIEGFVDSASR